LKIGKTKITKPEQNQELIRQHTNQIIRRRKEGEKRWSNTKSNKLVRRELGVKS
jgi:hypothetical protein